MFAGHQLAALRRPQDHDVKEFEFSQTLRCSGDQNRTRELLFEAIIDSADRGLDDRQSHFLTRRAALRRGQWNMFIHSSCKATASCQGVMPETKVRRTPGE